jgi:hypothetical protein
MATRATGSLLNSADVRYSNSWIRPWNPWQRRPRQVVHVHPWPAGQRVTRAEHDADRLLAQPDALQVLVVHVRETGHADVDPSGPDRVHALGLPHLAHLQRQAGVAGVHLGHQPRQRLVGERGGVGHRQVAGLARRRTAGLVARRRDQTQDRLGVADQHLPGLAELHPAGGAAEQLDAEFALQLLHLGAQGLLDHVQLARRPGEVELLGDGHEGPEVPQLDAAAHDRSRDVSTSTSASPRPGEYATPIGPVRRWGNSPSIDQDSWSIDQEWVFHKPRRSP